MTKREELIKIAAGEIGYLEKETNKDLDDKQANAGDRNYTKYSRDLHKAGYYQASKQGYAWCDVFVDWCVLQLMKTKEKAEWLQCQTGLYGAGCYWSAKYFRNAGRFGKEPEVGAQIFFGKEGDEEHTGIVESFDDSFVYTIEGNTNNQVARKKYNRTSSYIVGYGYLRFDEIEDEVIVEKKSNEEIAKEVIAGKWKNYPERKRLLEEAGYNYTEVQTLVNKMLSKPTKKSNEEIAKEVIRGKWKNYPERKKLLEAAGYNYSEIQTLVNKMLRG